MSAFLERLKESVNVIEQDWSYYDIKRAVLDTLSSGELGVLANIESDSIIVGSGDELSQERFNSFMEKVCEGNEYTDDDLSFLCEALMEPYSSPHAITAEIRDTNVVVTVLEKDKLTQHMMFRKSGKSVVRTKTAEECLSPSVVTSAINGFHKASKQGGDAKRRALAEDYKSFQRSTLRSREKRLSEYPSLSGDFWGDIHTLYDYTDCYDEFRALVSGTSVHSMGDRHLSRLSRATLAFDYDEDDLGGGKIYRAVPTNVDEIGAGDWVTRDEGYARSHAREMGSYGEDYHIISDEVAEGEIVMLTDMNEFVYIPDGLWGEDASSLKDVWLSINENNKPSSYPCIESMYESKVSSSNMKMKL